ncbi:hypothetical protein FM103_19460 [Corynebacterium xerosis]|nr:hypothetical protein FM103_19460 [Corynebacterium xerosis]
MRVQPGHAAVMVTTAWCSPAANSSSPRVVRSCSRESGRQRSHHAGT